MIERFSEGVSMEEAINILHMNFEVELLEATYKGKKTGKNWIVRKDRDEVLSVTGERYQPIQYQNSFSVLLEAAPEVKIIEAGVMRGGRIGFVQATFGEFFPQHYEKEVMGSILTLATSHDGSLPFTAFWSPYRLVCFNQLRRTIRGTKDVWKVRHTEQYGRRLEVVKASLVQTSDVEKDYKQLAEKLLTQSFSYHEMEQLSKTLFNYSPTKEDPQTRRENQVKKVMEICSSTEDLRGIRGTKWGAYQAITQYIDHESPRKGTEEEIEENRVYDTLFGRGIEMRDKVLELLLA